MLGGEWGRVQNINSCSKMAGPSKEDLPIMSWWEDLKIASQLNFRGHWTKLQVAPTGAEGWEREASGWKAGSWPAPRWQREWRRRARAVIWKPFLDTVHANRSCLSWHGSERRGPTILSLSAGKHPRQVKRFQLLRPPDENQLLKASQRMKGRNGWGRGFTQRRLGQQLTGWSWRWGRGRGQVCVFPECTRGLCSTYFDEINTSTEGLPPSRLGLVLGREKRNGKGMMIRNKGLEF